MSIITFSKLLSKGSAKVEEVIESILPARFPILFDGWNSGNGYYYIATSIYTFFIHIYEYLSIFFIGF